MPPTEAVQKVTSRPGQGASVRRITVPEGMTPESVLFPQEATPAQEMPALQSSSPVLIQPFEETIPQEATEQATGTMPDWLKDFSEQDRSALESFQGDPAKMAKAFLDTKRGFTDKAMEAGGLKQMVADMIAASKEAKEEQAKIKPVVTGGEVDLDAFAKNFSDEDFITKPQEAVKKILEVAGRIADARAAAQVHPLFQQIAQRQTETLLQDYPGLVTAENARVIDALATGMDGKNEHERYEGALKQFAKLTGYKKPSAKGEEEAEIPDQGQTQQMRQQAQLAPVTASVPAKKKVWTSRELNNMMIQRPDDYARLQPEIIKAYSEGRVKS